MTGFGNFLYFDKKADFSIERAVSMWIRINYFPILLSVFVGVPFDLLYIVPLHTTAFFITMITCYVAKQLEIRFNFPHWKRNCAALTACMVIHILFYETPMVNTLRFLFGKEILFRFQSDKYSAVLGIISGYFWNRAQSFVTWAHTPTTTPTGFNNPTLPDPTDGKTASSGGDATTLTPYFTPNQQKAIWGQRVGGVLLIALWWTLFGHIGDKFTYNPMHPFVFWLPVFGWLMIRNSSKYMTEVHSTALEFFGKITLETYVLQFHVFMCQNVQHIPIVIPGSGPDGHWIVKFCNMLLTGIGFVALAYWARKITVTTQTTVTDFLVLCMGNGGSSNGNSSDVAAVEKVPLTNNVDTADEESHPNVTVEITNGGLTHKSSDLDAATGK
jgi:N-acetylneuraminate 9-O-acetyltransferase